MANTCGSLTYARNLGALLSELIPHEDLASALPREISRYANWELEPAGAQSASSIFSRSSSDGCDRATGSPTVVS
jgi:hypothetical protein